MKPIYLEMTAFGPYLNKACVNFEAFGDGIYVIAGETGAGKTTIFDAIMFALFEEVSAKPNKDTNAQKGATRDKTMVHSDYASRDVPTEVRLIFEAGGVRYTVRRTIKFPKKRGGDFGDARFDAELEGGGISQTGSSRVTDEVRRILHMDAAKFRQIVMLAQGEFKAFMEAKDDRRKEILGDLFDSTPYRLFQERLAAAARTLLSEQKMLMSRVDAALDRSRFYLPPETSEEERAFYSAGHPQLGGMLDALCEKDSAAQAELMQERSALEARRAELSQKMGKAEAENKKAGELEKKRSHLAELHAKAEDWAKLGENVEQTDRAWHRIRPAELQLQEKTQALNEASGRLDAAKDGLQSAEARRAAAQAEVEGRNPQRREQADRLQEQIRKITENLGKLDQRKEAAERLAEAADRKTSAETARDGANRAKSAAETRLREIEAELAALDGAEARAAAKNAEYEAARAAASAFAEPRTGFLAEEAALSDQMAHLRQTRQTAQKAHLAWDAADRRAQDVRRRYLAGYAGKLGIELEREFAKQGEATCPVCGSSFCSADHPNFAVPQADTPDDAALAAAEEAAKAARQTAEEKRNAYTEEQAAIRQKRDALLDRLNAGFPGPDGWVFDESFREKLQAAADGLRAAEETCRQHWEAADREQNRKKLLDDEKKTVSEQRESALQEAAKQELAAAAAGGELTRWQETSGRLAQELADAGMTDYRTRDEAAAGSRRLQAEQKQIADRIEAAEKQLKEAESAVSTLSGQIAALAEGVRTAKEARAAAEIAFAGVLQAEGFTAISYKQARDRAGAPDPEHWLKAQRDQIAAYQNDCRNTEARIRELEQEKPVFTDLEAMKQQQNQLGEEAESLRRKDLELHTHAEGHRSAQKACRDAQTALQPLRRAYQWINGLAELANGSAGEGGKHAFDGYMLGQTFREVLDNASGYLTEMTGGKYELIHDTEAAGARKNSAADFRIQVRDTLTEEQREIGSLSGGESFQASMALALGLSDTVQSHVSTVKIETMFIDEGFGSLGTGSLQRMLDVLKRLSDGQRQIGIISHVDALEESASKFIRVTGSRDRQGSSLRQEPSVPFRSDKA